MSVYVCMHVYYVSDVASISLDCTAWGIVVVYGSVQLRQPVLETIHIITGITVLWLQCSGHSLVCSAQ